MYLLAHMTMFEEFLTFFDNEIKKRKFHLYESPIFSKDVDTENVLVSNNIYSNEKKHK